MRHEPIEEWDKRRKRVSKKRADITGQKFSQLTALRPVARDQWANIVWLCRCDCGQETRVSVNALRCNGTMSCGCALKRNGWPYGRRRISRAVVGGAP